MIQIHIDAASQRLSLLQTGKVRQSYLISTAKKGLGENLGSEQTPRGWHTVHQKIGTHEPLGRVFQTRLATDLIYDAALSARYAQRDWILTRIIRLAGMEMDFNLGGKVDSLARCIYIHGAVDQDVTGQANSHGCIRMRNQDIIRLYSKIDVGTPVLIQ